MAKQAFECSVAMLRPLDELMADNGFSCLPEGALVKVEEGSGGLFFRCADGKHYLDGQLNDKGDKYVGLLNTTRDDCC